LVYLLIGHTGKNCPDIASVKDATKSLKSGKSDLKKNEIVKKRKAKEELKVLPVKKVKVKHSKKIVEQKITTQTKIKRKKSVLQHQKRRKSSRNSNE